MENSKALLEKKAKTDAWQSAKKVRSNLDAASQELKREKGAHTETLKELSKAHEDLNTERGVSDSLRVEVENLKKALSDKEVELVEVTEILERVEQSANITYEDCVGKYKKFIAFIEEIETKARAFHEEGFNDCLAFVGVGNVVNPEVHSIDSFREAELAKYERGKNEAEENAKSEALKAGDVNTETERIEAGVERGETENIISEDVSQQGKNDIPVV